MNFPKNLIEGIQQNKSDSQTITFIHGFNSETQISYKELYSQALIRLSYLQNQSVPQDSHIIIYTNDLQEFLVTFWACILGGIVAVPVAIGISDEHKSKLMRIFKKLEHARIVTDSKQHELLLRYLQQNPDLSESQVRESTLLLENMPTNGEPARPIATKPERTAFIQFSSGSTREPKGIILSHANVIADAWGCGQRNHYNGNDTFLGWMPLTHDMGIVGFHLFPLLHQAKQCLIPTDLFSRRPLIWFKKVSEFRATVLSSPNFGYKHYLKTFMTKPDDSLDLSSVRVIYNGAEPISVELCQKFLDTMEPYGLKRTSIQPVYGLAESTLVSAMPDVNKGLNYVCVDRHQLKIGDRVCISECDDNNALAFAIEGPAIETCEIKITDDHNNSLDEETVGEIQIRGAAVTQGFYHDETATRSAFTGDGWLNTGDVGFIYQGQLVVSGRTKEIIFINGQNYYPHDLETIALEADPYLELGKIVAYGLTQDVAENSELIFFVVFRNDLDKFAPIARNITRHINEHTGLQVNQVIPVPRIPKTTSGKIQRHHLGANYMDGQYQELITQLDQILHTKTTLDKIESDSTEAKLLAVCNAAIEEITVGLNDNLFEIGISSLTLTELHEEIDALYPNTLDITDLFELPSIAEIAHYIDSKQ